MKRALISVFYKEGVDEVARKLQEKGWEILSTGGTAIDVTDIIHPDNLDMAVRAIKAIDNSGQLTNIPVLSEE